MKSYSSIAGVILMLSAGCAGAAMLSACTASQEASAVAVVKSETARAIAGYGIAKGIAGVAVLADPALEPAIAASEAVLDPLIANAKVTLAATGTDLTAVTALNNAITAEIIKLETLTASKITAVPNK